MPVYRLCGFSGILGLRPTAFQELLHLTRICGLCGVVPERTSLLPCGHALCQLCLDGMVSKGSVCPVDGGEFLGHDTPRLEFTSGDIAKYKAHCWNAENGCDFVGPVTHLLDHYNEQCVFHSVPCTRCKRPVLRRDFAEHWAADCAPLITESREAQESCRISDVTQALEKLSSDNAILQTTFNELLEGMRSENLSIRQSLSSSLGKVDSIARSIDSSHSFHWYLGNWTQLKSDALRGRPVDVRSDPVYVLRYNLSLKAQLRKERNTLKFSLYLRVTKGNFDSTLDWPFRKRYTLSIVHLKDPSKTISYTIDLRKESEDYWISMPGTSDITGCVWPLVYPSSVIESQGLVVNETVHLCAEIHP